MKKRILSTLLCVAMALGTLAGCGAKETTSDNVVVETEENVENETTNEEETTNTPIVEDERPEGAEIGKVVYTDWGTYTIVSSENGMDNIEVQFGDVAFKATVPQDMGATSSWNPGKKLVISNESGTKKLMLSCYDVTMEDKAQDDAYTEDELRAFWNNSTKEDGYYFKKEWLNENLLSIIFEANAIDVGTKKDVYGYASWRVDYEKGDCCQFYYAETKENANKEVAKIVAESIALVKAEELESYMSDIIETDNNGNISSEYLELYGLEKDSLVFPEQAIINETDNGFMSVANNTTLEKANEILNNFVSKVETYDRTGNIVTAPVEIPVENNFGKVDLYYKTNDGWNKIIFMYDIIETNGVLTNNVIKSVNTPF